MTAAGVGPVLVGVDIGTSAAKAVAVTLDGTVVATARRTHAVTRPAQGHVEHDAEEAWWGGLVWLVREIVGQLGGPERVAGLGVTTCGPCLVPVGDGGRPLRPAILYGVDTRGVALIPRLAGSGSGGTATGLPLTSQSIGPKIAWVREHEPEVAARTARWHTATSFLVERLTGSGAIDRHQAAYFGPYVTADGSGWDEHAPDGPLVTRALPPIRWPATVAGGLTPSAADATGLAGDVPVIVGTSDGPTATLGVGATRPGTVAVSHGTTTTVSTLGRRPSASATGLWATDGLDPDRPFAGGATSATGSLLDWITGLAGDHRAAAASVPLGAGGLAFVPTLDGERTPVDDPRARGTIAGITLAHGPADLVRAAYEGIAIAVLDLIDALEAAGIPAERLRVTGGLSGDPLLARVVADVTGLPQDVAPAHAGPALGVARLAGEVVGIVDPAADWFRPDRVVEPDPGLRDPAAELVARHRRLSAAVRPISHALAELAVTDPRR